MRCQNGTKIPGEAYKQEVQLIEEEMVGQWAIHLFVNDTAFLAEKAEDMNRILAAYNNFVNKWRIRINASKCRALKNEHVSADQGGHIQSTCLGGQK